MWLGILFIIPKSCIFVLDTNELEYSFFNEPIHPLCPGMVFGDKGAFDEETHDSFASFDALNGSIVKAQFVKVV